MERSRGRITVAAGLLAAAAIGLGVGAFAPPSGADAPPAGSGGQPAGTATAAGALVHYGDKETFFPGAATPALALATALKYLGPTATRDQVVAWLNSHPVPTGGLSPDLSYRPGDHRPFDTVTPVEVKGGKWVKVGAAFTPARVTEDINDGE